MKNYVIALVVFISATFPHLLSAQGFQNNGYSLYYLGNIGLGTKNADQRLTIEGGNIKVIGNLDDLGKPSSTYISIINKGIRGGLHDWKITTAASAGGWGVGPNAFEVWEYPELSNSSATTGLYQRRFAIQTNRDQSSCYPVIIGSKGSLNLGYASNYVASDYNLLSVNGNVGIGTTNSQGYKLAVNGTVRAKEVVVNTGWSDFVFRKDYRLPTLEEVEQHINEKGYLPNIPSEAEVEANGIGLGEINSKLLQKIEELTLYIIQLKKEMNSMSSEIKELKNNN